MTTEAWSPDSRRVPVTLSVLGAGFERAPGDGPSVSMVSLFFEVLGAGGRPMQDLYQVISLPHGEGAKAGGSDLTYPFELRLPAGGYTLHVTLRDLNGPLRGIFTRDFVVPAATGTGKAPS